MTAARLEVVEAENRRIVLIDKPVFSIGRQQGSDLCLSSRSVSREHAQIVREQDGYLIRDRSSMGTFVNDTAVRESALAHGDRIRLGPDDQAVLVFLSETESPSSPQTGSAVHDLRQMATLFQGLRAIGSAHALDEILGMVLDLTIEFTGAERGFIMLADAAGQLEFTQGRARGRVPLSGKTFETSRRIPEQVFATGVAQTVGDLLDANLSGAHMGTIALGIRHVLCLPLQLMRVQNTAGDASAQKRIGVLYLDSRQSGTLLSETTKAGVETLAKEAADAIESARLYNQELEKLRLEHDMDIAAQIQQALLPNGRYAGHGIDLAAVSVPCRSIGGDFFDYVEMADGHGFGFTLGDVAGKGPPAALLTASIQGVFSTRAPDGESPARTISRVNHAVIRRAIKARFVTMFYGVLRAETGSLTYCNGGHNAPILVSRGGVRRLEKGGLILGIFAHADYEEETVRLEPGDVLVVFSDGVSESVNPAEEQYDDHRIAACVQRYAGAEAAVILERLLEDVRAFCAGTAQPDDLTAMILKYNGPPAA
jgi:sigma-B regulation protein RsbU (phosphoserine phosphatase)